jgi:selenocysteine lyase/cysteine desulfurase
VDVLRKRENEIGARLLDGLKRLPGAKVYGLEEMTDAKRLCVFAVDFEGIDTAELAAQAGELGLETRPGLQCAPWAHRTIGSFPKGVLRLSPGAFSTEEEVDKALMILDQILRSQPGISPILA